MIETDVIDGQPDLNGRLPVAAPAGPLPTGSTDLVSVVVTTCNQPEEVLRLVAELAAGSYSAYEVVVVENRPADSRVAARCAGLEQVRCLEEPVPGLSRARNAGLQAAHGALVAFLDDDVTPASDWLSWVVNAFQEVPAASCVTGQILPMELDTRAQQLLEQYGGFSKGFERVVWARDTAHPDPLYPYIPGIFGSGANTAWRRQDLLELGGWDERLGAGTPARGGEDLEAFARVVRSGRTLVYEPSALVWHRHRPDMPALRRQMLSYGIGLGATAAAWLSDAPTRRDVLRRIPAGARRALSRTSGKNENRTSAYPRSLVGRELVGMALGPVCFARARTRAAGSAT